MFANHSVIHFIEAYGIFPSSHLTHNIACAATKAKPKSAGAKTKKPKIEEASPVEPPPAYTMEQLIEIGKAKVAEDAKKKR
jgi:hypothetical protein